MVALIDNELPCLIYKNQQGSFDSLTDDIINLIRYGC